MDLTYELFVSAIKTDATKLSYTTSLEKFKNFCEIKKYSQFTSMSTPRLKGFLVSYLNFLKSKDLKHSSISLYLSSVELFLDMNEVNYPKKVIRRLLPTENKKQGGEKPYTTDEIKRMLAVSPKLRTKALIHFFTSTGCRPNALHDPIVKISDMVDLPDGCKAILLYEDSKEEAWTFLTPEAVKSINDYIRSRKLNGEHIDETSPLFENKGKPIAFRAVRHIITRAVKNAGIERVKKGARYDKALIYGFRKRFNTILKITEGLNANIAEKLMAHKRGLDGVYLTPTMEECHKEFKKGIIEITIDSTERQKAEIQIKDEEITELQEKQKQIDEKDDRLDAVEIAVAKIIDSGMVSITPENKILVDKFLKGRSTII